MAESYNPQQVQTSRPTGSGHVRAMPGRFGRPIRPARRCSPASAGLFSSTPTGGRVDGRAAGSGGLGTGRRSGTRTHVLVFVRDGDAIYLSPRPWFAQPVLDRPGPLVHRPDVFPRQVQVTLDHRHRVTNSD